MIAIRAVLIIILASCSPNTGDGIRTPENWTLDKNSMYRDLSDGLLSKYEKHAFEVIQEEYLNANADGIEEEVVEAADNIEAIVDMIERYHENIAINKKLWQAIIDYEDSTCFKRRGLERLEVHLRARIGFQRKANASPKVKLEEFISLPDGVYHPTATIIDGGTTVFVYNFKKPHVTTIDSIENITLFKESLPEYYESKFKYGRGYCTKRALWGTLWCTKKDAVQHDTYHHEGDTIVVDGIDIYAKYPNDKRKYLVYSSLPTEQHQPLAVLSGVTPRYSVPSFRNNPHWVMHFFSSKCDGWGTADHDDSDFGREIWNDYASKGKPIGSNVLRKKFSCKDRSLTGIGIPPPDVINTYDENSDKLPDNVWHDDSSTELEANTEHTCQPIAVEQLMKQARKEVDTEMIDFDTSAEWAPEVLQEKRDILEGELDNLSNSSTGLQADYNKHHRMGCFYDRELPDGIKIKITGQVLNSIGGALFSEKEAKKELDINALPDVEDMPQLFIGFGYSEDLAYIGDVSPADGNDNGIYAITGQAAPGFTKNFTMRDMTYVHLARNFSEKFFQTLEGEIRFRNDFWGKGQDVKTENIKIEQNILSVTSIELSIGEEGNPSNPKQVIYKLKSIDLDESNQPVDAEYNKYGVLPSLFVLNNTSSAWTDFGLKGNSTWDEYRRENNLCDSK